MKSYKLAFDGGLLRRDYDYLPFPVARRLTALMIQMLLKPGGRLLVANFHPGLIDIGAMETTMNWWLRWRN